MMQPAAFVRVACLFLCIPVITRAEVPATLSTQGVIAVRGERFTGTEAFRFALVNVDTSAFLWKNDGSDIATPDAPVDAVLLQVVNGVYNAPLGDATITNMTAFPSNVFKKNQNVAVRVWFNDQAGGGMHVLTPDVTITTAPYTQYAAAATQLNIPGTDTAAVTVGATGNVGIGEPNPQDRLQVNGTIRSSELTVSGLVSGSGFDGWDRVQSDDLTTSTGFGGDVAGIWNNLAVGDNSHSHDFSTLNSPDFSGDVSGTWNDLQILDDSHTHTDVTMADDISIDNGRLYAPAGSGNVGIGTDNPQSKLDVRGDVAATGEYTGFGIMPIGSIVAWHKNLLCGNTGQPPCIGYEPPDGWIECNGPCGGTTPCSDDPLTPIDETLISNLNGERRFLRGSSESGEDEPGSSIWDGWNLGGGSGAIPKGSGILVKDGDGTLTGQALEYEAVAVAPNQVATGNRIKVSPINMSVVWIMRVK